MIWGSEAGEQKVGKRERKREKFCKKKPKLLFHELSSQKVQ